VLRSTENIDLAVEIINNLMSSHKICESAFHCASLPTVEDFYETYGSAKCFNLPERSGTLTLPSTTFKELRRDFMETAVSRSANTFDYRHCMRELHSVLTQVNCSPDLNDVELSQCVLDAVERIHNLRYQALLLH
jgi:hypothetical protein